MQSILKALLLLTVYIASLTDGHIRTQRQLNRMQRDAVVREQQPLLRGEANSSIDVPNYDYYIDEPLPPPKTDDRLKPFMPPRNKQTTPAPDNQALQSPKNKKPPFKSTEVPITDDQATQLKSGQDANTDSQASQISFSQAPTNNYQAPQFRSVQPPTTDSQVPQLNFDQSTTTDDQALQFRSPTTGPKGLQIIYPQDPTIPYQAPQSASVQAPTTDRKVSQINSDQSPTINDEASLFRSANTPSTDPQVPQIIPVQTSTTDDQAPQFSSLNNDSQTPLIISGEVPITDNKQPQVTSYQTPPADLQPIQSGSASAADGQVNRFKSAPPSATDDQTPQFKSFEAFPPERAYQRNPTEEEINFRSSAGIPNPSTGSSPDYCKFGANHTMCMYDKQGCQINNIDIISSAMGPNDIHIALGLHNYLRHQVSVGRVTGLPPAVPEIPTLEWDPELAAIAQRWADQCTPDHDMNRRTENFPAVGQNEYWIGSTSAFERKSLWKETVEGWFDEVIEFLKNGGSVSSFDESHINLWKKTGGFTQVIWSTTLYLGCGQFIMRNPADQLRYQAFLVCNYAPAGNVIDRPIYSPKSS